MLGRYLDVTAPSLFGREVNLYWDGAQIPRFLWVTAQDLPGWLSAGAVAGVLLLLWGPLSPAALGHRVGRRARPCPMRCARAGCGWLTAAAVVLVAANYAGVRATWPVVSKPVIPTYWRQAKLLLTALSPQRLEAGAAAVHRAADGAGGAAPARRWAALRGRDVYLIFMESYGAVAYDNPQAVAGLAAARRRFADDIAAGGRQVVSAFMRSPTYGGASDLAHLSVLSGIDLSDPMRHDLLLTTDRPTLTTLFRASGYQVFGLYPALRWEWPERAFYGFDEFIDSARAGLSRPAARLLEHSRPVFAGALRAAASAPAPTRRRGSCSFRPSPATFPFSPVPPYQPDWQRVLTDQPFDAADVERALAEQVNWLNMFPDYLRMVEYTYRWLGGFLRQPEPRETVFVLLGDHQPTANISGEGASWDVPVHIVSRDAALLPALCRTGLPRPGSTRRASRWAACPT